MKKIAETAKHKILLTSHAAKRSKERNICHNKIAAMVLWLGCEKLQELVGNDIIIHSNAYRVSVVATIDKTNVRIITVVPKSYTFTTDIEKIRFKIN